MFKPGKVTSQIAIVAVWFGTRRFMQWFQLQQEKGWNLEKREESLQKYHIFSSEMTSLTFTNSNHRKYNNVLVFQPFRLFSTFYGFNLFKVTESKYVSSLILSLYNPFRFNRFGKRTFTMKFIKFPSSYKAGPHM